MPRVKLAYTTEQRIVARALDKANFSCTAIARIMGLKSNGVAIHLINHDPKTETTRMTATQKRLGEALEMAFRKAERAGAKAMADVFRELVKELEPTGHETKETVPPVSP